MHFNFLVGNHFYLTQEKHEVILTFSDTGNFQKQNEITQHDQSCQTDTLERVPEDLLNGRFSLIYYFLR